MCLPSSEQLVVSHQFPVRAAAAGCSCPAAARPAALEPGISSSGVSSDPAAGVWSADPGASAAARAAGAAAPSPAAAAGRHDGEIRSNRRREKCEHVSPNVELTTDI